DLDLLLFSQIPCVIGVEVLEGADQAFGESIVDTGGNAALALDGVLLRRDCVLLILGGGKETGNADAGVQVNRIEVETDGAVVGVEFSRIVIAVEDDRSVLECVV